MEHYQSNVLINFGACAVFWLALQSNLDKDPNRALNFKIGTFPSLTLIMTSELFALRDTCHWVSVILSSKHPSSILYPRHHPPPDHYSNEEGFLVVLWCWALVILLLVIIVFKIILIGAMKG